MAAAPESEERREPPSGAHGHEHGAGHGHEHHAGHEHEHAEPFPRLLTAELVARAEALQARREALVAWTIGAGLAVIALGLPSERVWGHLVAVPDGALAHGVLGARVRELAQLLGTSAERAWFLVSATAYGLCVPAITALARAFGFAPRVALGAALVALLAPLAWTAARLPDPFACGVLGAALLLRALVADTGEGAPSRLARVVALALLAIALHPQNALLVPVAALASVRRGGAREREDRGAHAHASPAVRANAPPPARASTRHVAAFARTLAYVALAIAVAALLVAHFRAEPARAALARLVLAGRDGGPLQLLGWAGVLTIGLGVSALGLHALLFARRAPEESPPPRWLRLACAVALVPIAAGSPAWAPSLPWLVVAAAIGVADATARQAREERALRNLGLAVAAQIAIAALVSALFAATDPERGWRDHARASLEPTDTVLTSDAVHAYLLRERWAIDCLAVPRAPSAAEVDALRQDAAARLRAAAAARSRIVVDGEIDELPEPLRGLAAELGAVALPHLAAP